MPQHPGCLLLLQHLVPARCCMLLQSIKQQPEAKQNSIHIHSHLH
jgi:hypothetical protein